MKNQRCQPLASLRNENAAPRLWARTMSKNDVTRRAVAELQARRRSSPWSPGRGRSPPGRCRARARARHRARAAIRPPSALRRRRTGSPCSGRRSSDAPGRGRRRCGSASSARTSAPSRPSASTKNSFASAAAASGSLRAAEVIRTKRRSSPRVASSSAVAGPALTVTSACSDEPRRPSLRSASIFLFDSARTAAMRAHLASSASFSHARASL